MLDLLLGEVFLPSCETRRAHTVDLCEGQITLLNNMPTVIKNVNIFHIFTLSCICNFKVEENFRREKGVKKT